MRRDSHFATVLDGASELRIATATIFDDARNHRALTRLGIVGIILPRNHVHDRANEFASNNGQDAPSAATNDNGGRCAIPVMVVVRVEDRHEQRRRIL